MPRKMRLSDIDEMFVLLSQTNPDPQTELTFQNAYTLLVAVVLSAQATDLSVNRATKRLFAEADTPEAMVALGLEQIRSHIKTIGLFNTNAKIRGCSTGQRCIRSSARRGAKNGECSVKRGLWRADDCS